MNPVLSNCPVCKSDLVISRLHCRSCETTIDGTFFAGPFASLNAEQLEFIELFVRVEGKLNRMEKELKMSYPTIRNRLHEVIRALGFDPGEADDSGLSEDQRQTILEQLNKGDITAQEAMELLGS